MSSTHARTTLLSLSLLAAVACAAAQAQTIYRIVNPDGSITVTDKPPADVSKSTAVTSRGLPVPTSNAAIPYELRQATERFPVTLYTGKDCVPCNSGRALLRQRGVPYTELTVSTSEDVEALQRISGDRSLPLLTIGSQKIKGFSDTEWTQFLTAASYPARSLLAANYRFAEPRPLVVVQRPEAAPAAPAAPAQGQVADDASRPAEGPSVAPPVTSTNPNGIRF
jgi:glutaredoxin